jgi:hypothetical protein
MIRPSRAVTAPLLLAGVLGAAGLALAAPAASAPQAGASPAAPVDPYGAAGPSGAATPATPSAPPAAPLSGAPAAPSAPLSGGSAAPPAPPSGAPAAPPADAAAAKLAEDVAFAVAARAQELLDAKQYADAKQLAIEAVARSPRGVAAERAHVILRAANRGLGLPDPEQAPAPSEPEVKPPGPAEQAPAPAAPPAAPPPRDAGAPSPRQSARIHGGLYGGVLGAALGSLIADEVGLEIAAGAAGAAAAAWFAPRFARRLDVEQVRTVGSASLWGGVAGGLLADVVTSLDDTSPRQVLLGAAVGASLGGGAGSLLARSRPFTRGDVALLDTLAATGALGGVTLGLVMQPVESEAYSLNAALGAAAGLVVGAIAAPKSNTTPRRMARVAGLTAVGGAAPWLLYLAVADDTTSDDERLVGGLSTAGLVAGLVLGLRWTRDIDEGQDVPLRRRARVDDAPLAMLRRSSTGRLSLGGPAMRTSLQAPQPAYLVDVVAGRF